MKKKTTGVIRSNNKIAPGIYDMIIETEIAREAHPGQFVGVYLNDNSRLLPRPISVCEVSDEKSALRLVYRVSGRGTEILASYGTGDEIALLGILGNGYDMKKAENMHNITLMAGGIGIPPILQLAKELSHSKGENVKIAAVLGYRDSNLFLSEELKKYCDVYIATDDGSAGFKGNAVDSLDHYKLTPDIIYACGPMPMLRGIKRYSEEHDIEAYISLEERMACGVGACLGCVCKTVSKDEHSNVNNARICTDGPVFPASEVDI